MMTGDATINRGAAVVACTAEVLANIGLAEGAHAPIEYVVMDEFHYYADRERGMAWQLPLITMPQSTFLLMSATLGDTTDFERRIPEFTGRELSLVKTETRPVPLQFDYSEESLTETVQKLLDRDQAPIYLVNFTQREATELAQGLVSMAPGSREERQAIAQEIADVRFDSVFGKDIQRFLKAGIGVHHAGLLPKYRLLVERLAQKGMLKVISGTDTLGVGVNVPIRTVLFTKLCKFDGEKVGILTVRDFKQIAGRAGRKGFDDRGWVVAQAPEHVIENKRLEAKAKAAGKKKFKRKTPPERGYVPWDENTFRKLIDGDPEPLESSFNVNHGLILNVVKRANALRTHDDPLDEVLELVRSSYEREGKVARLEDDVRVLYQALIDAAILDVEEKDGGRVVRLATELKDQDEDFSLFHSLSLYVLDALQLLDKNAETYPLDVLTVAESVLENPRVVLIAQEKKAKSDAVAAMKAEGIEYEERMERLDEITYPKPGADFIYDTFNRFAAQHPWVGENIRPKSVARDMIERYADFNEYVKEYGLSRSEGVLLRYLNEAYKTLQSTVPDAFKTEGVHDIIAYLRAMLARVDSSLVQEWERLMGMESTEQEDAALPVPIPVDISKDAKAFRARIRAELHFLVQSLAAGEYETAAHAARTDPEVDPPWDEAQIRAAIEPFIEEHGQPVFDHRARQPDKTFVEPLEDHLWRVRQVLIDPQEDNMWMIEGEVDLRDDKNPPGALVAITRIGT